MSDIYNILSHAGFSPKHKGSWIFICCPFHQEDTASLGIKDNYFKCFGCSKTGSLNYLLQELGIIDIPDLDVVDIEHEKIMNTIVNKLTEINGIPSNSEPFQHEYRNIKPETYKAFSTFTSKYYPDEIIFPIYYENTVRGLIRKPLNGKYLLNFYSGYIPFNINSVFPTNLILVEGVFDALSVWQAGYKNVVSILGTGNVFKIKNWLTQINARNVKILFDGDIPGENAAKKMNEVYPNSKIIKMPEGTDPNSLSNIKAFLKEQL